MKTLLINGFGWSGSGAIIDDLSARDGFYGLRDDFEEASIFKGRYSLAWIINRIKRGEAVFSKKDVLNFIFYMAGQRPYFPGDLSGSDSVNLKRNELLQWGVGKSFLLCQAFDLADKVFSESDQPGRFLSRENDIEEIARDYFCALSAERRRRKCLDEKSTIIVNNDPSGYNVDLFQLLPNCDAFVVTRNLLDVYANLVLRGKFENSFEGCRAFVRDQKKKAGVFSSKLYDAPDEVLRRITVVPFEAYVLGEEVRQAVYDYVGAGDAAVHKFDPERSRRKIGLFDSMCESGELAGFDADELWDAENERLSVMKKAGRLLGARQVLGAQFLDRGYSLAKKESV